MGGRNGAFQGTGGECIWKLQRWLGSGVDALKGFQYNIGSAFKRSEMGNLNFENLKLIFLRFKDKR